MALFKRQDIDTIIDDQGSIMLNSYVGDWTHYSAEGLNNSTATATTTPGASFSFTYTGIQIAYAWSCCVVLTL
jgi:hypothetical protein